MSACCLQLWKKNSTKTSFREIEAYSNVFSNLLVIGKSLIKVDETSGDKCLYSEIGTYDNKIGQTSDEINREAFYGRALLFHVSQCAYLAEVHLVGGLLVKKLN